jgi:hypothetical protein
MRGSKRASKVREGLVLCRPMCVVLTRHISPSACVAPSARARCEKVLCCVDQYVLC